MPKRNSSLLSSRSSPSLVSCKQSSDTESLYKLTRLQHPRHMSRYWWRPKWLVHWRAILEQPRCLPQWVQRAVLCIRDCGFCFRWYRTCWLSCCRDCQSSQIASHGGEASFLENLPFLYRLFDLGRLASAIQRPPSHRSFFGLRRSRFSVCHRHCRCRYPDSRLGNERGHHDSSSISWQLLHLRIFTHIGSSSGAGTSPKDLCLH